MTTDLDAAAASAQPRAATGDLLEKMRDMIREWRGLSAAISDLEDRLSAAKSQRLAVERQHLPELFAEAGVGGVSVDAEGNLPAVEAKLVPYCRASIPVGWPPERKDEAFKTLDRLGLSDLVTTEVKVAFGREESLEAERLAHKLKLGGYKPEIDRRVHHASLTSAVAELSSGVSAVSPSDLSSIGAEVGHFVKITEKKEAR